jgi:hypothetical protein
MQIKGTAMSAKKTRKKIGHSGATFDSSLEAEGIREEVEAVAIKRVLAWQTAKQTSPRCQTRTRRLIGSRKFSNA